MLPTSTHVTTDVAKNLPTGVEAIAVLVAEGKGVANEPPNALSEQQRAALSQLVASGLSRGKAREVAIVPVEDGAKTPQKLLALGLGPESKLTPEVLRQAAGSLAKAVRRHHLRSVALVAPAALAERVGGDEAIDALVTGFALASFRYREYKGAVSRKKGGEEDAEEKETRLTLVVPEADLKTARETATRARAVADGQNFARTIASRPGNDINPPTLAAVAQQLAKEVGLTCRILDEKQMQKLGMGGILAVGAGSSATPPRMIVLEHNVGAGAASKAKGAGKGKKGGETSKTASKVPPLLVVGKAITFDTGGISIKPAEKMGKMIYDKSGGMAVLGLMYALAKLKLPVPVVGILSSAENHISETAYRPGDILRMYNGVTVEVTNTDAEGRLVLADALAWGIETYQPSAVLDLATLTGGVIVALGHTMAGVMANDDALFGELQAAADRAGEKIWRLPLGDEQRELIKSDHADIVNSAGRFAHPLQGGAFLSHFIPDGTPWAHLDIAGVADTEKDLPYYAKGSTAWGVRTLVEWVKRRAARF